MLPLRTHPAPWDPAPATPPPAPAPMLDLDTLDLKRLRAIQLVARQPNLRTAAQVAPNTPKNL